MGMKIDHNIVNGGGSMKNRLIILSLSLMSTFASAESDSYDSQCRYQAKEAAISTYQTCVKEARSAKIDEIRKEYQEKLSELKSHYDSELKKMTPSKSSDMGTDEAQPQIQLKKKGKKIANKKLVTQLPSKKNSTLTLPVQNVSESTAVIAGKSEDSSPYSEKEISTVNESEEKISGQE